MGRILTFIIAYRNTFLFIILQIFSLTAIFRFHFYQKAAFFNNANAVGASINKTQTTWRNYFYLQELNENLLMQNAALLANKQDTLHSQDTANWAEKINTSNFEIIPAHIIFNTTNRPSNTFVIDKGSNHNVMVGLGVATSGGIAGKVINVYPNYALCLSILNVNTPIVMPKILELENKSGTIEWGGSNPKMAKLKGIHKYEEIKAGNHVVSSGYSINFPENIPVGTIKTLSKPGGSMYDIEIELAAHLKTDYYAYVFRNKDKVILDSIIELNQIVP